MHVFQINQTTNLKLNRCNVTTLYNFFLHQTDKGKRSSIDLLREDIDLPIKREPQSPGGRSIYRLTLFSIFFIEKRTMSDCFDKAGIIFCIFRTN